MAITVSGSEITGISNGGLPSGTITRAEIGYAGAIMQVQHIQTRTAVSYAAPVITAGTGLTNPGTQIAILNLVITPTKAGNKIILEWMLNQETHQNIQYIVVRDGTIMSDSADANRWSGLGGNNTYANDGTTADDIASTPLNDRYMFVDNSCLSTTTTYSLYVRSSGATARTVWFNRSYSSAGADDYETGVSTVTATEIRV